MPLEHSGDEANAGCRLTLRTHRNDSTPTTTRHSPSITMKSPGSSYRRGFNGSGRTRRGFSRHIYDRFDARCRNLQLDPHRLAVLQLDPWGIQRTACCEARSIRLDRPGGLGWRPSELLELLAGADTVSWSCVDNRLQLFPESLE
jgi:hypothetical protein